MQIKTAFSSLKHSHIVALLIAVVLILAVPLTLFFSQREQVTRQSAATSVLFHVFGGFSIDTPERVLDASSVGVQLTIDYGDPPSPTSAVGQQLLASHMKVIDGFIASSLYYYECHKSKILPDPTDPQKNYWKQMYCNTDTPPFYESDADFLAAVRAHLQAVKNNQLIIGYWNLDDQALWDKSGYAINILNKAHTLIQQYTPNKPVVCGFGALLGVNNTYSWYSPLVLNFTPSGCDMVGLYIYSASQPDSNPVATPNVFDWSMAGLLPKIFSSLRARGWDITKQPLVGIPQAWGGPRTDVTTVYEVVPSVQNMQTQALSFCQAGVSALIWYAWNDSTASYFPSNTSTMKQGVQQGIAACKSYWNSRNLPS